MFPVSPVFQPFRVHRQKGKIWVCPISRTSNGRVYDRFRSPEAIYSCQLSAEQSQFSFPAFYEIAQLSVTAKKLYELYEFSSSWGKTFPLQLSAPITTRPLCAFLPPLEHTHTPVAFPSKLHTRPRRDRPPPPRHESRLMVPGNLAHGRSDPRPMATASSDAGPTSAGQCARAARQQLRPSSSAADH